MKFRNILFAVAVLLLPDSSCFSGSAVTGEEPVKVLATVETGSKTHHLQSNDDDRFGRVYLQPQEIVKVEIQYSEGQEGERTVLSVEDGGFLNNTVGATDGDKRVLGMALSSDGKLSFQFTAGSDRGLYRVTLKKGLDTKTLDFWVGEPLPVAK